MKIIIFGDRLSEFTTEIKPLKRQERMMEMRSGLKLSVFCLVMVACFVVVPVFVGAECLNPDESGECSAAAPGDSSGSSGQPLANPEAYGTEDSTILLVHSGSMTPIRSTYTYTQSFGWRWCDTGSNCWFDASLDLPSGTKVEKVELECYDNSSTDDVRVWFYECNLLAEDCSSSFDASTGDSETPEYTILELDLSAENITVEKLAKDYSARIRVGGDSNTRFRSIRVYYKRQISPAPGVATFNDVPLGYWAFQQVEAMANSGITTGCGSGFYCPDDYVTRAQMAVFFSRALGLHWPN